MPTSLKISPCLAADTKDSKKLSIDGSLGRLVFIHKIPEEQKALRSFMRVRDQLRKDIGRKKCQLKSFLKSEGVESSQDAKSWSREYENWLCKIKFSHNVIKESFGHLLEAYHHAKVQLVKMDKQLPKKMEDFGLEKEVSRLDSVFGIGLLSALVILSELGRNVQDRFSNSKQMASFLGLTPGQYSSGDKQKFGRITRCGNSKVRSTLVESSWFLIRRDPVMKEFFLKIAYKRGRKRAIIAVARKLATKIHAMFRKSEDYIIKEVA